MGEEACMYVYLGEAYVLFGMMGGVDPYGPSHYMKQLLWALYQKKRKRTQYKRCVSSVTPSTLKQ
jgi:hypothetical protein